MVCAARAASGDADHVQVFIDTHVFLYIYIYV